jgi:hypothetical protein
MLIYIAITATKSRDSTPDEHVAHASHKFENAEAAMTVDHMRTVAQDTPHVKLTDALEGLPAPVLFRDTFLNNHPILLEYLAQVQLSWIRSIDTKILLFYPIKERCQTPTDNHCMNDECIHANRWFGRTWWSLIVASSRLNFDDDKLYPFLYSIEKTRLHNERWSSSTLELEVVASVKRKIDDDGEEDVDVRATQYRT